jgi:hypothetical protein
MRSISLSGSEAKENHVTKRTVEVIRDTRLARDF